MQGVNGQAPGGAYIVGLDAETGKEAWRFYTIARPGEPGGDSWNGLPLEQAHGRLGLDCGQLRRRAQARLLRPGTDVRHGAAARPGRRTRRHERSALHELRPLRSNPDTGKLAWHFQHVPNDQWDFDWAFERQTHRAPRRRPRAQGARDGRQRGDLRRARSRGRRRYLFSIDLGLQNFITAIDPRTGAKKIDPKFVPSREKPDGRVPACRRREELGAGVDQSRDARCSSCRSSNPAWI